MASHPLRFHFLAVTASVLILAGCATSSPPRTAASDANVKSVAIVSLLDEKAPVFREGLTVFNNDRATVDQEGALNRIAVEVVEAHLRAARSDWKIVKAAVDVDTKGHRSYDLQKLVQDTHVDRVFVIKDQPFAQTNSWGVGLYLRTRSMSYITTAVVHASIDLDAVDSQGKQIISRSGDQVTVPASELGIAYDLAVLKEPRARGLVSAALQKELRSALNAAAASMGY